jgi:hypothetical protein
MEIVLFATRLFRQSLQLRLVLLRICIEFLLLLEILGNVFLKRLLHRWNLVPVISELILQRAVASFECFNARAIPPTFQQHHRLSHKELLRINSFI